MTSLSVPAINTTTAAASDGTSPALSFVDTSISFGSHMAVRGVTLQVPARQVTTLVGPSGCGKTTLLRAVNRLHDHVGGRVEGRVQLGDLDVYGTGTRAELVRSRVGMVFQRPNPFPTMSIYDNVVSGLRFAGIHKKSVLRDAAEHALRQAALWDLVEHRLNQPAVRLSGGQQQRLCIARALAVQPEVLLMDEPCSALDPIATAKVEQLITRLAHEVTIVLVTHNMFQAARVSDYVAVLLMADDRVGELVEAGPAAAGPARPERPPDAGVRERPRRLRDLKRPGLFGLYTAGVQISAKVDYGVRALLVLAAASEPMTAEAIAKDQGLPAKFLGVIMNDLRRGRDRREPSGPRSWLSPQPARLGDQPRRRDPRPGRPAGPGEGLASRDCDLPGGRRAPPGGMDSSAGQPASCARARVDRERRQR